MTGAILKLSLPVVLGMMVQVLYNLVDTFFFGRLGDPNQLAAANITTPAFMIMMTISGIVGTGASSYISRILGEKNFTQANKTLSTGADIATVLGNLLGAAYYINYYAGKKSMVKFSVRNIGFSKEIWGQIWGIGTPASIGQLLMSVALIICNNLAVAYGDVAVAERGVANKIMTIGTFVFMGFAGGCQPLVGFKSGAANFRRANEIIKKQCCTVCVGALFLPALELLPAA